MQPNGTLKAASLPDRPAREAGVTENTALDSILQRVRAITNRLGRLPELHRGKETSPSSVKMYGTPLHAAANAAEQDTPKVFGLLVDLSHIAGHTRLHLETELASTIPLITHLLVSRPLEGWNGVKVQSHQGLTRLVAS